MAIFTTRYLLIPGNISLNIPMQRSRDVDNLAISDPNSRPWYRSLCSDIKPHCSSLQGTPEICSLKFLDIFYRPGSPGQKTTQVVGRMMCLQLYVLIIVFRDKEIHCGTRPAIEGTQP